MRTMHIVSTDNRCSGASPGGSTERECSRECSSVEKEDEEEDEEEEIHPSSMSRSTVVDEKVGGRPASEDRPSCCCYASVTNVAIVGMIALDSRIAPF